MLRETTPVPNIIFDKIVPLLTLSEIRVLLVIVRQTHGWIDRKTNKRKTKDRISQSQFVMKSKLCKRAISKALQGLLTKGIIAITDEKGTLLLSPAERKGISKLYYSFNPAHSVTSTSARNVADPAHESALDKRNYMKETNIKERSGGMKHISEFLKGK